MKRVIFSSILIFSVILLLSGTLIAINTSDTRMMHQPAISSTHIAFIYANDLWVANIDGSNPRRLTSDAGAESGPFFSPDGKHIAFSAGYDGNTDIYTVAAEGGIPQRLTWHPSGDYVRGFTPDGKSVLFASSREDFSNRYTQLFTVPVSGGISTRLIIPNAYQAAYSPNGKQMIYTPISPRFQEWKNYRGGTTSTLWVFNFENHKTLKIPQPEGRCNDWYPIWQGSTIYFLSDRNGEFNLFAWHQDKKE